jgi:putative DNA primase/helicase
VGAGGVRLVGLGEGGGGVAELHHLVLLVGGKAGEELRLIHVEEDAVDRVEGQAIPAGDPRLESHPARFALVAFAGELATRYGVTGWQPREAFCAARRCFREWLAENNTGQAADDRALFAQVGAFMQAHSSTRFPPHDAAPDVLARYLNRAGFTFTDDDGSLQFWAMPESFKKELCKGFQPRNAARALIKAGWMLAGDIEGNKQRSARQKRIRP